MDSSSRSDHFNVYAMMEHLGLDTAAGVIPRLGVIYASAANACHGCAHAAECSDWLEAASPTLRLPPRFCPNAELFSGLIFDQPSAWRSDTCTAPH